jgi:hypothetical protein
MPSPSDPYAILGVPRDATDGEIGRAHRRLAKAMHPDLSDDPAAAARIRQINDAWRILSRPSLRAAWDAAHAVPASSSPWAPLGRVPANRSARPAPAGSTGWIVLVVVMILMVGLLVGGVVAAAGRPTIPGTGSPGYHSNLP